VTHTSDTSAPGQVAPVILAQETVALGVRSWFRVTAQQDPRGHLALELYVVRPGCDDIRLFILPSRIRDMARALDRIAGQLGVRP